jgi:hypothetical protein
MQSNKIVTSLILLLCIVIWFGASDAAVLDMVPGDVDANGLTNISDAVYLIAHIFGNGPAPPNFRAADVNDDCINNVSDVVAVVGFIFDPSHDPLLLGCPHQEFNSGCIGFADSSAKGGLDHRQAAGDCLADPGQDPVESMYAEFIGDDLHVYHFNAFYNCCLEYVTDVEWMDYRHVVITESDTGAPCDCLCYFDLEAVIEDIMVFEPTEFVVTLIGIGGYTVGVDTLYLGGNGYMYAEAEGNDLHIHHMNAYYNCCIGYQVNYQISEFEITAVEADTGTPCYCLCYFNFESILYDLEDGNYLVRLIGLEGDTVGVEYVTIPGETGMIGEEKPDSAQLPRKSYLYPGRE